MPASSGSSRGAGTILKPRLFSKAKKTPTNTNQFQPSASKTFTFTPHPAQNDQSFPYHGQAIAFFSPLPLCHINTTSQKTPSLKGATTPATTFSPGSSFSIAQSLFEQITTPKKLHKFQFSAREGILNTLHTFRSFAFPISQPRLQ